MTQNSIGNEASTTPVLPDEAPLPKANAGFISRMVLANFGASMAFLVPLSYSLAVRVNDLAPGREQVLGYVTGAASLIYILASPLIGLWSDRTVSRLGRRLPFVLGGGLIGLAGLAGIALAPSALLVGVGWVIGSLSWNTAQSMVQNLMVDRLADSQRGKVAGLMGLTSQLAAIAGIGLAYAVKIPSALARLIAPFIIAGGAHDGQKNYPLRYRAGGVFALIGGLVIITRVRSVR